MKFKRKLGTVDAHNVNFNFTPDNTDSHNIILNFEHFADGSTNLNFGDHVTAEINTQLDDFAFEVSAIYADSDANIATVDTALDAEFHYEVNAVFSENTDIKAQIDCVLDADFSFDVQAIFAENYCVIDTVLDTPSFEAVAYFDINHIVGVSLGLTAQFEKAIACLSATEIPWAKPILRVSNEALFYDRALVITSNCQLNFEEANHLSCAVRLTHEQATSLQSDVIAVFENAERRFVYQRYVQDEALKLRHNQEAKWEEMIRRRKQFTYSHEVAEKIEHCFSFAYDLGLQVVTQSELPWDVGKAIHYRKHPVQPWPKPKKPQYKGSTDLNFICLCHNVDSHNVVLNFGQDDCIPALPKKKWWYILNTLYAERLDTGERIAVLDGTYQTSRSNWCWSYSITIAYDEKDKLQPINNESVILKIMINSYEHHVLLETASETRRFARKTYTYAGRSVTALNSADYASKRSYIQDNQREAAALVQAELERARAGTTLNWQLIDELGWAVPLNGLSYAELAPMDAIKQIVEVGGGFIYSEKSGNTLSILPRYKKAHWDAMTADDYDILINESAVIEQTIEKNPEYLADYNAVTLVNSRSGDDWKIKQRNSSDDIPLETTVGPMFDVMSAQSNGKMQLIQANVQEIHTFSGLPITNELGEMLPGKTIAFGGQWWGVIDSVSGSYSHSEATETIKVERIHRD